MDKEEMNRRIAALANHYTREELIIEIHKQLARENEHLRQLRNSGGAGEVRVHNYAITQLNGVLRRLEYGKRND